MKGWHYGLTSLVIGASVALVGCGGGTENPMGPGAMGPGGMPVESSSFMSLSPGGGSMGVPVGSALEFRWDVAMGVGMEQFVDLHMGNLSGPVAPMSCAWSRDQTTLACSPSSPLEPGTRYVVHMGGGMVDTNGQLIDMGMYGPRFGGQWVQGGMMGSGHVGTPWGMMGGRWQHANGSYGMAFTFTTA